MAYICNKCGKKIKQLEGGNIRCSYCGSRIMVKGRTNLAKEVPTD
jgi:DNA-directed RNA polymerase subunit RPC12/RpoP